MENCNSGLRILQHFSVAFFFYEIKFTLSAAMRGER